MNEPLPVLYILMRMDLNSLNSGKGMSQASHASNAFAKYMHYDMLETDLGVECERMFNEWAATTDQGFGTVLVLGVNEREMRDAVNNAKEIGLHAGVVHDPTYPLVDGDTVHCISLDTCAWVFTPNKSDSVVGMVLGHLSLHP